MPLRVWQAFQKVLPDYGILLTAQIENTFFRE